MTGKTKTQKPKFFLTIGILGLFAVLTGFSTTFLIPLSKGTFNAPVIIYIHGILAFSWISLFIIQSFLIQRNRFKQHKVLGFIGVGIAVGVTLTFVPVGVYQVQKELNQGLGQVAISSIIGTITAAIIFMSLVIVGIQKRNEPATHKRLMLLATIMLLWPAWFRFRHLFPSVPHPEIWFAVVLADSLIIISILWDKITFGRINPALLYTGLFIILEHVTEVIMFNTPIWNKLANTIYGLLI